MSKKIMKNIVYLRNLRPKSISPYRKDADVIVAMYERGEIKNIKTAINLISKLASTRPEATASKINEYLSVQKSLNIKPVVSHLDKGLDEDADYTIKSDIKQPAIRSTPKPKAQIVSIKKKLIVQPKLERFCMRANVSYTSTYEKMNKSRKTKALHSHYYSRTENQAIDRTIYATSEVEARKQFKAEITDDIEERDHYKKSRKVDDFDITQSTPESEYKQEGSGSMLMRSAITSNTILYLQTINYYKMKAFVF
jgi:hypothetical protein